MDTGPWIRTESGRHVRACEITSILYVADGDTDSYRVACTTRTPMEQSHRYRGNDAPSGENQVWLCRTPNGHQTMLDLMLAIAQAKDTDLITTSQTDGKTSVRRGSLLPPPPPEED